MALWYAFRGGSVLYHHRLSQRNFEPDDPLPQMQSIANLKLLRLKTLVGAAGLEPATLCLEDRRPPKAANCAGRRRVPARG